MGLPYPRRTQSTGAGVTSKPDADPRLETPIMREILIAVSRLPEGMFWRANVGVAITFGGRVVRFNVKGMPDIMGAYRSRPVGIETKTSSGRLNTYQINFRDAFTNAGGIYILARSLDDALSGLSGL